MIVLKLRVARRRKKAKSGRWEGAKPCGDRGGEDAVIGRMKALRASGPGFDKIASDLTRSASSPAGGPMARVDSRSHADGEGPDRVTAAGGFISEVTCRSPDRLKNHDTQGP
jgi:hypothetical protein